MVAYARGRQVVAAHPGATVLPPGWKAALGQEFDRAYMQELREFLQREVDAGHGIAPAFPAVFRAFQLVDLPQVRVVILGQDPYPGKGLATGLAFAAGAGMPPSLSNVFGEVERNTGSRPQSPLLTGWASQGILLLNSVLTVRIGSAFSHRNRGWETFTDAALRAAAAQAHRTVFLLWGAAAHRKSPLIASPHHRVLRAPHPSPLSAHRGFAGCGHFSEVNRLLVEAGGEPVHWAQS